MAYRESIIIRPDSTFITISGREGEINVHTLTSRNEWKKLVNSISNYKLIDLENIPSPTDYRAIDGAMFSRIIISTNKREYDCGEFDSYRPNKKLNRLMEVMLKIRDSKL